MTSGLYSKGTQPILFLTGVENKRARALLETADYAPYHILIYEGDRKDVVDWLGDYAFKCIVELVDDMGTTTISNVTSSFRTHVRNAGIYAREEFNFDLCSFSTPSIRMNVKYAKCLMLLLVAILKEEHPCFERLERRGDFYYGAGNRNVLIVSHPSRIGNAFELWDKCSATLLVPTGDSCSISDYVCPETKLVIWIPEHITSTGISLHTGQSFGKWSVYLSSFPVALGCGCSALGSPNTLVAKVDCPLTLTVLTQLRSLVEQLNHEEETYAIRK